MLEGLVRNERLALSPAASQATMLLATPIPNKVLPSQDQCDVRVCPTLGE